MQRRASFVLFVVAAAACADAASTAERLAGRVDTVAGVEHVVHQGPAPVWRLERERSIGRLMGPDSAPSADEFGRITWLALDARGLVYVADGAAREIRVFDTAGAHVRTIGRRGAGPGEFQSPQAIAFLGDTLVVMDPFNGRLALLDTLGVHVGQWPYGAFSGSADWFHDLAGDTLAVMSLVRGAGPARRAYVMLTNAGPGDTVLALVAPERNVPRGMDCEGAGGAIHIYSTPIAPRHIAAPAPGGGFVAVWSDAYRIAFLDGPLDTVRVVEQIGERFLVPDTMRARIDAEYDEFRRTPGMGRCTPPSLPRYDILPPLRHLMFDDHRRLWVEVLDGEGQRWDIFSPAGALLGSARSGPRVRVGHPVIRDGRLAVVEEAPEGHHRVVVYRIVEAPT